MNKEMIFYRHLRTSSWEPKGGVTFKVKLQPEANRAEVAIALCRDDELFCFKNGREVATEKMDSGQVFHLINYNHETSTMLNIETALWNSNNEAYGFPMFEERVPSNVLKKIGTCLDNF